MFARAARQRVVERGLRRLYITLFATGDMSARPAACRAYGAMQHAGGEVPKRMLKFRGWRPDAEQENIYIISIVAYALSGDAAL